LQKWHFPIFAIFVRNMAATKKVLVTGGAGFIGSHTVVELHQAGYEPVMVDNFTNSKQGILRRIQRLCGKDIHCYHIDCRETKELARVFAVEGPFFAVIHFAAFKAVGESVEQPAMYYNNNIGSLACLLEVMAGNEWPGLVFSSSCTVYGQPSKLPVTEDAPIQPASSPYGYTKQVCEQLIQDSVNAQVGLKAVTLRYFNPIGAHPSGLIGELPLGTPNNLVPYITQAAAGLRGPLRIYGRDYNTPDGTAIRDYIHVVDLARAHVMALDVLRQREGASFHHIANVGTGSGHSVLEVVRAFEQASGMTLPYAFADRRPGDVEAVWSASDPDRLPGWKAALSLEEAMRDAWNWQQNLATHPIL
jgi:UDP-glucose 4-epimerase